MNRIFQILLLMVIGILSAQKGTYYQQFAKYKMDIDVDATNFTYQGKQSIIYTNNSLQMSYLWCIFICIGMPLRVVQ